MASGIPNMWLFWTPYSQVTWHGACAVNFWPLNGQMQLWGFISLKRFKIDAWFQWITNRKLHMPSQMVTWPMTSRDPKRSNSWPQNLWNPVSPYTCKIDAWSSLTTNRKLPTPSLMVTWSMTSRDPKRSRSWPPKYLRFSVFMAV